ncbi:MAG TPA: site-2 protease family protein, partial [Planctomycetota bacterium]|nr:site-2 protease family protein [Planctomycetota bacterium]
RRAGARPGLGGRGAVCYQARPRAPRPPPRSPAILDQLGIAGTAVLIGLLIVCLSVHEWAHAWSAHKLGDPTAEKLGRLTLNPIAHVDPFMSIVLPAVMVLTTGMLFGGAKPVPVNPLNFRNMYRDFALVSLAGPLSNLVLAAVFVLAGHAVAATGQWDGRLLPLILDYGAFFNVLLAVFNLVPIPPLDGSRIATWLLPRHLRDGYNRFESIGLILILALFSFVPAFGRAIFAMVQAVLGALERVVSLGGLW